MRIFTDSIAIENNESSLFDSTACTHTAQHSHTVIRHVNVLIQFIALTRRTHGTRIIWAIHQCRKVNDKPNGWPGDANVRVCARNPALLSSCSSICKIIIIDCTQRNNRATRRSEIEDGDSILAWNIRNKSHRKN